MQVIATAKGYYGSLRKIGEKFEVKDGETASWFEPTDAKDAKAKPQGKGAKGDDLV